MEKELFSGAATDTDLSFESPDHITVPLAARMRPRSLDEYCGQDHVLSEGKLLRRLICADRLQSAIFYGPAGCGKTSLGEIIASMTNGVYEQLNAVESNSAEMRKIIERAREWKRIDQAKKTVLFIDEIHRFNKAQQDILMPAVERGDVILIGATTHNPSFALNGPLLSRSTVFELLPLSDEALSQVLAAALQDTERGFGMLPTDCSNDALQHIIAQSSGDARRALNALEIAVRTTEPSHDGVRYISKAVAEECVQKKMVAYDRDDDYHYDTISAFIKSMRGSDPDASIYWLAKMLYAGEDILFIARRIVIFASEDVGNADPHALSVAVNALSAVQFVGMPEARIILGHAVTYMATAPKSNAAYCAINDALADVKERKVAVVPDHLCGSGHKRHKDITQESDYKYPHDYANHVVAQEYCPSAGQYYRPTTQGYERIILQRMNVIKQHNMKGGAKDDSK